MVRALIAFATCAMLCFSLSVGGLSVLHAGPVATHTLLQVSVTNGFPCVFPIGRSQHKPRRATLPPSGLPSSQPMRSWVWESDTSDHSSPAYAGYAGAAGDVNGDGCADILISEPAYDHFRGRVLAWYGARQGLPTSPSWVIAGRTNPPVPLRYVGAKGAGDLNGDGYDDIVVTFNHPPGAGGSLDRVEVFFGSAAGLPQQAGWQVTAAELSVNAFLLAGSAGDVNGDGYADLWVLAEARKSAGFSYYRVLIFHGSATGLKHAPDTSWEVDHAFQDDAPNLTCAGDVNGDGYDDLIEGDPEWSGTARLCGRVHLFYGSAQGLIPTPAWTTTCDLPTKKGAVEADGRLFGWSAAGAGDVNGDGFDDVVIGAPFAAHGDVDEGLAFVYFGSRAGLSQKSDWSVESNHPHALLGYSVSSAGDVNGDGFADVLLGAPQAADGQINEGAALVFRGSRSGLERSPHWCRESDNSNQRFGLLVLAAGDVNGDGCDDVLVAAPEFERGGQRVGRVCLYYGSPAGLTGSTEWRIDKPMLIAMQQWLTSLSSSWKWFSVGSLILLCLGSVAAWRRAVARQRRAERETALAKERERISRDMHDHLGANLSQILLWTGLARRTAGHAPQTLEQLGRIEGSAGGALRSIRDLVQTMAPSAASLAVFADHLADQAQECLEPTDLQLRLDLPDSFPELMLTPEARSHLSLFAREALRNVVQHARARRVVLGLQIQDHVLRLTVADDGHGLVSGPQPIATGGHQGNGGNGLRNLRARAASLGGEMSLQSQPGQGTSVTITVPLKRVQALD